MTAAQTAAKTDKANERFVVITGTVPSREIEVATRSEATELAHRTNGSWTRVSTNGRSNMHITKNTLSNGQPVEFRGANLYDITATTDDGQTAHAVIAADREGLAKTRLMAVQTTMTLAGQFVSYEIKTIA